MKRDYMERFIHIGTSELYGSVDHPATEADPIKPTSPYAASKAASDSAHSPDSAVTPCRGLSLSR